MSIVKSNKSNNPPNQSNMSEMFDVESFRNPNESNTEWKMRRKFLLAHHETLDVDRLVCLANCYVNVEVYGCTYPVETMRELKALIDQL
ncbi:hypothetical protein DPMN_157200 [Dreissena polymorpha]|uniref:XRN2-binding (XTBD) domain-containing protein n=1 Tax=Dreissena polymorpha TaxID=45954 RepID=A0A9D4EHG0_DREPO|nr:hypothetical protein DPMN_157200 [Dreissena polymorpha]